MAIEELSDQANLPHSVGEIAIPHAVGLEFDQYRYAAFEVYGCSMDEIGELLIVGRDLMNRYRVEFDGQSLAFTIF